MPQMLNNGQRRYTIVIDRACRMDNIMNEPEPVIRIQMESLFDGGEYLYLNADTLGEETADKAVKTLYGKYSENVPEDQDVFQAHINLFVCEDVSDLTRERVDWLRDFFDAYSRTYPDAHTFLCVCKDDRNTENDRESMRYALETLLTRDGPRLLLVDTKPNTSVKRWLDACVRFLHCIRRETEHLATPLLQDSEPEVWTWTMSRFDEDAVNAAIDAHRRAERKVWNDAWEANANAIVEEYRKEVYTPIADPTARIMSALNTGALQQRLRGCRRDRDEIVEELERVCKIAEERYRTERDRLLAEPKAEVLERRCSELLDAVPADQWTELCMRLNDGRWEPEAVPELNLDDCRKPETWRRVSVPVFQAQVSAELDRCFKILIESREKWFMQYLLQKLTKVIEGKNADEEQKEREDKLNECETRLLRLGWQPGDWRMGVPSARDYLQRILTLSDDQTAVVGIPQYVRKDYYVLSKYTVEEWADRSLGGEMVEGAPGGGINDKRVFCFPNQWESDHAMGEYELITLVRTTYTKKQMYDSLYRVFRLRDPRQDAGARSEGQSEG